MTVRIIIEAETAEEALKEARRIGGPLDPTHVSIAGKTFDLVPDEVPSGGVVSVPADPPAPPVESTPTPTPPVAPSAPVEPTLTIHDGPPPPAVEVDSRGIPWDARVHAGNKATSKKDGSWKKRRNVDPALYAQVEAELKAALIPAIDALPTAGAAPPPPPATEPPPVSFGKLLASGNNDIKVLDGAIAVVSKGQYTTIGEVAALPAWIQAVYDYIQQP